MRLTYKYRIHPTKNQTRTLEDWLTVCQKLYNSALQERKESWGQDQKSISYIDQALELTKSRSKDLTLRKIHSQVLQDVLRRLDKAFQNFFRRIKNHEKPGYPRFQGYQRYDSFTYPQFTEIKIQDNKIKLPKIGYIRIKYHRLVTGKPKTLTVKKYTNQWYIMISSEVQERPKIQEIKNSVGIDLGLSRLAVLSTGETISNPRYLKKSELKLKQKQRCLSKKIKGSRNRNKRRIILSKAHRKIRNQRSDFLHKVSRDLVTRFDLLVFEDLNIKSMLQNNNKRLNKSTIDVSWNMLTNFCNYKAEYAGKFIEFVDPRNTTKTCSRCGNIQDMRLEDRTYNCKLCGLKIDRDLNASYNILNRSKIGKDLPESKPLEILVGESKKEEACE